MEVSRVEQEHAAYEQAKQQREQAQAPTTPCVIAFNIDANHRQMHPWPILANALRELATEETVSVRRG